LKGISDSGFLRVYALNSLQSPYSAIFTGSMGKKITKSHWFRVNIPFNSNGIALGHSALAMDNVLNFLSGKALAFFVSRKQTYPWTAASVFLGTL
jgi:hypothetical protein